MVFNRMQSLKSLYFEVNMQMKVAVLGHTFVQEENRARWERFGEIYGDSSVTLLVPRHWEENRYGASTEFQVERYTSDNFEIIPLARFHPGRDLYLSYDISLRRLKPDILHIIEDPFDWKTSQALLYKRLWSPEAVVVGCTASNIDYQHEHFRHELKERLYFRNIDAMCAVSQETERILRLHGFGKPVLVQHENGADERLWFPGNGSEVRAGWQAQGIVVGFVGALLPEKGAVDLAKALVGLDTDWTWIIIGDGEVRVDIASILSGAGALKQARFLGYLPRGQIPALMRALDVLVLPSRTTTTWKEQFGLVLAEAMLSGVTTVGSDSGAIPDVIGDAGIVFPEGDVEALTACLQRLIDNPVLRRELAERGRRRALENYSVTALARQSFEFFSELLAGRRL
jgi:glycosyltransferase involved in cell wall biosynthesis